MLEKAKALLRENSLCVLATCSENNPHCSLMSYVTDERAEAIHMVTLRTSRKCLNIIQNPHVSLLVDSRANIEGGTAGITALTVSGTSSLVRDPIEKTAVLARMERAHPHLRELVLHPDAEVIAVDVESFLLLEGPTRSSFLEVSKQV